MDVRGDSKKVFRAIKRGKTKQAKTICKYRVHHSELSVFIES